MCSKYKDQSVVCKTCGKHVIVSAEMQQARLAHGFYDAYPDTCRDCNLVCFEYNGLPFALTAEEIEAAYYYYQHQCVLEDAVGNLNLYIFGTKEDEVNLESEPNKELLAHFERHWEISYPDACAQTHAMADHFINNYSALESEESQWALAIEYVLDQILKK